VVVKEKNGGQVVESVMNELGAPSLRKFAEWLTERMPKEGKQLSHATIINWINDKGFSTDFFENILVIYPPSERQFQFALTMLAAKSPLVWGENGVVWKFQNLRTLKVSKESLIESIIQKEAGDNPAS
jgi:hypothetical protein